MMLAPKDESLYIEVICVKDVRELDDVWGSLEVNKGDIRLALKQKCTFEGYVHHWVNCHMIKYGSGMWPVDKSHFKTLDEIRDDRLKELGI